MVPLPRNFNMSRHLSREKSATISQPYSTIAPVGDCFIAINSVGMAVLFEPQHYSELRCLDLVRTKIDRGLFDDAGAALIMSPLCHFRVFCDKTWPSKYMHESALHVTRSRLVLANLSVLEAAPPDPSAPVDPKKKKAPSASGTSEAEVKVQFRILVLDVSTRAVKDGPFVGDMQLVHELLLDVGSAPGNALDHAQLMFDGLALDLSLDGRFLSVVCSSFNGGGKIYSLSEISGSSSIVSTAATEHVVATAVDGSEDADSGDITAPRSLQLPKPAISAVVPADCDFFLRARIRTACLLPRYRPSAATAHSHELEGCGLLVTLVDSPRCVILGFRAKSNSELEAATDAAAAVTAGGAKGGKPAGAAAIAAAAPKETPPLDVCMVTYWSATAAITASACDREDRALLATGARDGTVELWSLAERCLLDTLGRHAGAPVTCLVVQRESSGANYSALCAAKVAVLSGAADGTLCFFKAVTEKDDTKAANCFPEHVRLCDYRHDVHSAAVLDIQLPPTALPLALVEYSNGALSAYAMEPFRLIGRLEKRERVDFQNLFSVFYTWQDLPKFEDPVKKAAAELAAALAAQEAEAQRLLQVQQAAAEAEKAAKAGKAPKPTPLSEPPPGPQAESSSEQIAEMESRQAAPEMQEESVNAMPYNDILAAIGSGSASCAWRAHRSVKALSASHLICSANRHGEVLAAAFNLQSLLQTAAETAPSAETALSIDSKIDSNTLGKKNAKLQSRGEVLRLAEERLHLHESEMASRAPRVPVQSLPADPAAILHSSILRSRNERNARKVALQRNASALMALL